MEAISVFFFFLLMVVADSLDPRSGYRTSCFSPSESIIDINERYPVDR